MDHWFGSCSTLENYFKPTTKKTKQKKQTTSANDYTTRLEKNNIMKSFINKNYLGRPQIIGRKAKEKKKNNYLGNNRKN